MVVKTEDGGGVLTKAPRSPRQDKSKNNQLVSGEVRKEKKEAEDKARREAEDARLAYELAKE